MGESKDHFLRPSQAFASLQRTRGNVVDVLFIHANTSTEISQKYSKIEGYLRIRHNRTTTTVFVPPTKGHRLLSSSEVFVNTVDGIWVSESHTRVYTCGGRSPALGGSSVGPLVNCIPVEQVE